MSCFMRWAGLFSQTDCESCRGGEMAAPAGGGGGGAKAAVAEQIAQAVRSTSNLLQLMEQSSPAQVSGPTSVHLAKLPKNLLAKVSSAKNTEQVLHQLPQVISSLDAYMDRSFQRLKFILFNIISNKLLHFFFEIKCSASQIKTVTQLLSNMENTQLRSILPSSQLKKDIENDKTLKNSGFNDMFPET
ncbi:hypothetical protein HU200_041963 [Digitaria exilis]|uniref:Tobamovirus multiplication protein 2B n=1 Tax=Digitaria exilis TaxID=1010633 RepID=A0A835EG55_9POAL|nr:hypothetical protein HU200_041963 [Digitaria exilis]